MGTRADYYIGRGKNAEWLGSTAWDGYPEGVIDQKDEQNLFTSKTEDDFRKRLKVYFDDREDVTLPADGWPWPWKTSSTTDYTYAFDDGQVWMSCFGQNWIPAQINPGGDNKDWEWPDDNKAVFPDMTEIQNVQLGGKKSGLIVISG